MATSQIPPGGNAFSSALPPNIAPPAPSLISNTGIVTATSTLPPPSSSTSPPSRSEETSSVPVSDSTSEGASPTPSSSNRSESAAFSTSTPTSNPVSSRSQGKLTTGSIVGVALAGVALVALLACLVWLYLKRRRETRQQRRRGSRWSDSDKHLPGSGPGGDGHLESGFAPARTSRFYAAPRQNEDKRRSFWRKSVKPEDIGLAVSPEIGHGNQHSPRSVSSQRTTSRLLPDLPHPSLWPSPLRKSQQKIKTPKKLPERPLPTIAFPSTFVSSPPTKPPRIVSSRTGNGLPTDPRAQMLREDQKSVYNRIPLTPVYDNGNGPAFASIGANVQTGLGVPPYQRSQHHESYYSPFVAKGQNTEAQRPPPPSLLPAAHIKNSAPIPPPAVRRQSSASDVTTFEEDDDVTPEETRKEVKFPPLSPVEESPRRLPSPPKPMNPERPAASVRGLTYPSLPQVRSGPTALSQRQAPSQPQATAFRALPPPRTASPASQLLAKRKGDQTAEQMLQHGLRISSTNANLGRPKVMGTRTANPGQRRGSGAENNMPTSYAYGKPFSPKSMRSGPPSAGLTSPRNWTPKLTPTKRGQDLYLSVE